MQHAGAAMEPARRPAVLELGRQPPRFEQEKTAGLERVDDAVADRLELPRLRALLETPMQKTRSKRPSRSSVAMSWCRALTFGNSRQRTAARSTACMIKSVATISASGKRWAICSVK